MATLELAKAYDKVNWFLLLCDCGRYLNKGVTKMLKPCFHVMRVTTKGYVLGKGAKLRFDLTKGAPLSPILFLVHVNDLHQFYPRLTNFEVLEEIL